MKLEQRLWIACSALSFYFGKAFWIQKSRRMSRIRLVMMAFLDLVDVGSQARIADLRTTCAAFTYFGTDHISLYLCRTGWEGSSVMSWTYVFFQDSRLTTLEYTGRIMAMGTVSLETTFEYAMHTISCLRVSRLGTKPSGALALLRLVTSDQ